MKLAHRVAVVTGGGSGIGAAICRALAAAGATVAVTDLQGAAAECVAAEIRGSGGQALAWDFDVSDHTAADTAATEIEERLGSIEIWVNNAGISRIVPFLDCSDALWDRILRINLTGTFIGCQVALSRMVPRQKGVILNMSSQSGKSGNSQYSAYCASKAGVIGLTQSLAQEFADRGIRVNALCPGVVFTALWHEQEEDYARKRGISPAEVRPYLEARIPLGRLCTPAEVAQVAVFLASDEASYITGQAINITGGALMH